MKLAGSIVAIASIQPLQQFLRAESCSDRTLARAMGLHAMFLTGAPVLARTDRIRAATRPPKG